MSTINYQKFPSLQTFEDLDDYYENKYAHHTEYNHYAGKNAIKSIVKNNEFWISSVKGFNDCEDTAQFTDNLNAYYSLCFSTGTEENLALWFIYSNKDGGRIRFNKFNQISKIIDNSTFTLAIKNANNTTTNLMTLQKGKDFDLIIGDIIYKGQEKKGKVALRYNTFINYHIACKEIKKFKEEHVGFIKDNIWYYEKETRVLIKLKDNVLKSITFNENKEYIIKMNFSNVKLYKLNVDLSPGITENEFYDLSKELISSKYQVAIKPSCFFGKIRKWPNN